MTILKVTSKFRVTISKEIRQTMQLKGGQKVQMRLHGQGQAVLESVVGMRSARGMLKPLAQGRGSNE